MSSPWRSPNAIASLVAAIATADRKLLSSFIACPSPASRPHVNDPRSGVPEQRWRSAGRRRRVPANMIAMVALRAPAAPARDRGIQVLDARLRQRGVHRARRGDTDGGGVDHRVHPAIPGTGQLLDHPAHRAAVGQAQDDGARAPRDPPGCPPPAALPAAPAPGSRRRSCTSRRWPAPARLAAIGAPMLPRPMKPSVVSPMTGSRASLYGVITSPPACGERAGARAGRGWDRRPRMNASSCSTRPFPLDTWPTSRSGSPPPRFNRTKSMSLVARGSP